MQQTLLIIDPWWFQGPLLIGWLIFSVIVLLVQYWRHGLGKEVGGLLPILLVVAAVIHFVLPGLMIQGTNPEDPAGELVPIGLAIRGYGVMMLLAIVAGVALAVVRGGQIGLSAEKVISLAFWMIICGIIGARLFYVIQHGDQLPEATSLWDKLRLMVDMTRGGLVVYGSLLGALAAMFIFVARHAVSFWATADALAPAMAIGLAIGRIGCLLNGCCFGGACDVSYLQTHFPPGSPPYMRQLETGSLLGLTTKPVDSEDSQIPDELEPWARKVLVVRPGSIADELGLQVGQTIVIRHRGDRPIRDWFQRGLDVRSQIVIDTARGGRYGVPVARLPDRSLPIHPTQIYSAINAFLIALFLWFLFPYRRRAGDLFATLLLVYPITRFMLEYVRVDEAPIDPYGWFTISQWISIAMFAMGVGIWAASPWRPVAEPVDPTGQSDEPEAPKN